MKKIYLKVVFVVVNLLMSMVCVAGYQPSEPPSDSWAWELIDEDNVGDSTGMDIYEIYMFIEEFGSGADNESYVHTKITFEPSSFTDFKNGSAVLLDIDDNVSKRWCQFLYRDNDPSNLWRHYGVGKVEFGKPSFN